MKKLIKIGTRASLLAVTQSTWVKNQIEQQYPGTTVELVKITTKGDKILDVPLAKVGGKGLFVKEIEDALLDGQVDLAVHSMKDVPADLPDGLCIAAILEREDPQDAFVSSQYASIDALPEGARVGTSSLRRQCQLRARRPDLEILDLRGNVGTRLAKLDAGDYDAIILACAGLKRLGLEARITTALAPEVMLPAIAQGVIGIESRCDDERVKALIEPLHHDVTGQRTQAERAMNATLAGGCQAPVAGYSVIGSAGIEMRGLVGRPDGTEIIRGDIRGPAQDAAALGEQLAEELLSRGAGQILDELLSGE